MIWNEIQLGKYTFIAILLSDRFYLGLVIWAGIACVLDSNYIVNWAHSSQPWICIAGDWWKELVRCWCSVQGVDAACDVLMQRAVCWCNVSYADVQCSLLVQLAVCWYTVLAKCVGAVRWCSMQCVEVLAAWEILHLLYNNLTYRFQFWFFQSDSLSCFSLCSSFFCS